ncbi:MAG: VWA domain-containing protein [bacterium]|jgi:hypothetical protein|nr:MAG: hypothetical protein DIU52_09635 [bacterium]
MEVLGWSLYALAVLAALAVAGYIYLVRETPGRGRLLLASLRFAALALLALLIFDPEIPAAGIAAGAGRTRVLLDGSLSMRLPADAASGPSRWERAVAEARRLAPGRDVVVFGAGTRVLSADSLAAFQPDAPASELLPALQAASEAGARHVVILTDGGLEDAAEVVRALPELGMDVEVRSVADAAPANRALAEVSLPPWAEAGKPVEARVGVTSLGPEGDSVTVVVRQGDRVLAQTRIATAAPGRVAVGTLRFTPESPQGGGAAGERGGLVRYDFELQPGDVEADDDRRSAYVFVSERPAGVALVSFRPDWEPRYLQPVLEQALGVPVRGFAFVGDGRYVRIAAGLEAGRRAGEVEVRQAVEQADLLVLHGLDATAPAWAREAAGRARRLLVFPGDGAPVGLPVEVSAPAPGEWYVSSELPSSPLAGMLGTFRAEELPPLVGLRTVSGGGTWTALVASRSRRGPTSPVIVAGERAGRRWAVALADGFWQWAFRGGEARQVYRRLWAALGGWLAHEERTIAAAAVRPVDRTAPRGEPVRWVAPGLAADSVAFRITAEDGTLALDTVVPMLRGDTAVTPALAPGHYAFEARAFSGGQEVAAATGPFTVESYSPEFTRQAVELAGLQAARPGGAPPRRRAGEPLHTSPWPYLALAMLVCTEWTLRRRWGLR